MCVFCCIRGEKTIMLRRAVCNTTYTNIDVPQKWGFAIFRARNPPSTRPGHPARFRAYPAGMGHKWEIRAMTIWFLATFVGTAVVRIAGPF
jgi:hypothetical protein